MTQSGTVRRLSAGSRFHAGLSRQILLACGKLRESLLRSRTMAAVATICLLQFVGCSSEPPPPTLTGGKPFSYWIQALRAPDAGERKKAAFELGNVGPMDPAVIPALTAALQDRDARVRCAALLALVKSPKAAVAALPTVQALAQRDPDPTVRNYAARAAKKLEASQPKAEDSQ